MAHFCGHVCPHPHNPTLQTKVVYFKPSSLSPTTKNVIRWWRIYNQNEQNC